MRHLVNADKLSDKQFLFPHFPPHFNRLQSCFEETLIHSKAEVKATQRVKVLAAPAKGRKWEFNELSRN
jgi:hypothetical protein